MSDNDERAETGGLVTESEPERYVRVAIKRTAKGHTFDSSVSIRGPLSLAQIDRELNDLNVVAALAAKREIEARSQLEDRAVNGVASRIQATPYRRSDPKTWTADPRDFTDEQLESAYFDVFGRPEGDHTQAGDGSLGDGERAFLQDSLRRRLSPSHPAFLPHEPDLAF